MPMHLIFHSKTVPLDKELPRSQRLPPQPIALIRASNKNNNMIELK